MIALFRRFVAGLVPVVAFGSALCAGCTRRDGMHERAASDSALELAPASSVAPPSSPVPDRAAAFRERAQERDRMVKDQLESRDVDDPKVLAAMRKVPRHAFVPEDVAGRAYEDRPLPIGSGQTISQPYIVAFMTQAGQPKPTDKCLEIGTGSGYQAAVLAEVCKKTYSIEYLADVARFGAHNLRALGYGADRVELRVGDGYQGWPEAAPFDVVLVTAAPDHVPQPLLEQLAVGGRMVIPIGPNASNQELERWTRMRSGSDRAALRHERLMAVRFVPFLGDAAGKR